MVDDGKEMVPHLAIWLCFCFNACCHYFIVPLCHPSADGSSVPDLPLPRLVPFHPLFYI